MSEKITERTNNTKNVLFYGLFFKLQHTAHDKAKNKNTVKMNFRKHCIIKREGNTTLAVATYALPSPDNGPL